MFLEKFRVPNKNEEAEIVSGFRNTFYDTYYPFDIFPQKGLKNITFEQITIFYGGNGSGKSTLLNVIADAIMANRYTSYNKTNMFDAYVKNCSYEINNRNELNEKSIITSDSVFNYMFDVRNINEGVDRKKVDISEKWFKYKYQSSAANLGLKDYDTLKEIYDSRRGTKHNYIKNRIAPNIRELSNGESALMYFESRITENGVFILDEPENSLSPERQMELAKFIEDSARFYNCQIILATHSPFLLSLNGAKIYDLDSRPAKISKWSELENIITYFRFFKENEMFFK